MVTGIWPVEGELGFQRKRMILVSTVSCGERQLSKVPVVVSTWFCDVVNTFCSYRYCPEKRWWGRYEVVAVPQWPLEVEAPVPPGQNHCVD